MFIILEMLLFFYSQKLFILRKQIIHYSMNGLFMLTQAADYVEGKNQQQQPPAQPPPPQFQEKIVTDYPQPPQQPNPGKFLVISKVVI